MLRLDSQTAMRISRMVSAAYCTVLMSQLTASMISGPAAKPINFQCGARPFPLNAGQLEHQHELM